MKKVMVASLFVCLYMISWSQGINFEQSTFEELKIKAKKENKLIFIDAYTVWCGPCKWMAKSVFTNDTVGAFFNKNFISAKIDMEKGEGIDFAKKYKVNCYPNLLIFNGDGEVIHRQGGGLKPAAFIDFAQKALDGKNTYSYYINQFQDHKQDHSFLIEYINYLGHTCLPIDEPINTYFSLIDSSKYSERQNWNMLLNYANSIESKQFTYLINHQNEFANKYTQDSVDMKIISVLHKSAGKMIYSNPIKENELTNYLKKIESLNIPQSKRVIFSIKLDLYIKKNDWVGYENELIKNGDIYLSKNQYNAVAWNIYEKISNEILLKKAANWMKILTDSQSEDVNNYAELDTYACVLYKLKNKNEALKIAEKAIEKAKKIGMKESQFEETTELLSKIKSL